ncbi:hypothetical protein AMK21_14565 [Streptomyces sp. CB00316]|nr:hypothetical protein AMK21_14565 [Streptomyces sp. CB00316]
MTAKARTPRRRAKETSSAVTVFRGCSQAGSGGVDRETLSGGAGRGRAGAPPGGLDRQAFGRGARP